MCFSNLAIFTTHPHYQPEVTRKRKAPIYEFASDSEPELEVRTLKHRKVKADATMFSLPMKVHKLSPSNFGKMKLLIAVPGSRPFQDLVESLRPINNEQGNWAKLAGEIRERMFEFYLLDMPGPQAVPPTTTQYGNEGHVLITSRQSVAAVSKSFATDIEKVWVDNATSTSRTNLDISKPATFKLEHGSQPSSRATSRSRSLRLWLTIFTMPPSMLIASSSGSSSLELYSSAGTGRTPRLKPNSLPSLRPRCARKMASMCQRSKRARFVARASSAITCS